MTRFEYAVIKAAFFGGYEIQYRDRIEKVKGEITGLLNMLGESGWELVSISFDQIGMIKKFFLKRTV